MDSSWVWSAVANQSGGDGNYCLAVRKELHQFQNGAIVESECVESS